MKRNYIIAAFRETVAQQFPEQSVELNRLLDEKLSRLRSMHLNASKGKQFHLESQILPGIAAYETLQTVMPEEMVEIPGITVPNIRAVLCVQNRVLAEQNTLRAGRLVEELLQKAEESRRDNG